MEPPHCSRLRRAFVASTLAAPRTSVNSKLRRCGTGAAPRRGGVAAAGGAQLVADLGPVGGRRAGSAGRVAGPATAPSGGREPRRRGPARSRERRPKHAVPRPPQESGMTTLAAGASPISTAAPCRKARCAAPSATTAANTAPRRAHERAGGAAGSPAGPGRRRAGRGRGRPPLRDGRSVHRGGVAGSRLGTAGRANFRCEARESSSRARTAWASLATGGLGDRRDGRSLPPCDCPGIVSCALVGSGRPC